MKIIPLSEPMLGDLEKEWVSKCLESGYVSSVGPMVEDFERKFAEYVGSRHAVATASGTAALHVALRALGIGPGDAVVVPDLTFIASVNPVLYNGAEPVLADVDRATWCLDGEMFAELIFALKQAGLRPRAVIPVHLYGSACAMQPILETAAMHSLRVVEDATESLGARVNGRFTGTWGDLGCFSFNGNKLMTTGAGGMVVTNSPQLARRVRYLVNQARDAAGKYLHSEMGYNYRLGSLAAALGMAQLERIDELLGAKRRIAGRYREAFSSARHITCHPEPQKVEGNYWLYSILAANPSLNARWLASLNQAGIMARPFFMPLHRQPYLPHRVWTRTENGVAPAETGVSDVLAECGINLPSSCGMSEEDQQIVIDHLLKLAME